MPLWLYNSMYLFRPEMMCTEADLSDVRGGGEGEGVAGQAVRLLLQRWQRLLHQRLLTITLGTVKTCTRNLYIKRQFVLFIIIIICIIIFFIICSFTHFLAGKRLINANSVDHKSSRVLWEENLQNRYVNPSRDITF